MASQGKPTDEEIARIDSLEPATALIRAEYISADLTQRHKMEEMQKQADIESSKTKAALEQKIAEGEAAVKQKLAQEEGLEKLKVQRWLTITVLLVAVVITLVSSYVIINPNSSANSLDKAWIGLMAVLAGLGGYAFGKGK